MIQKLCRSVGTGAVEGGAGLRRAGLAGVLIGFVRELQRHTFPISV